MHPRNNDALPDVLPFTGPLSSHATACSQRPERGDLRRMMPFVCGLVAFQPRGVAAVLRAAA